MAAMTGFRSLTPNLLWTPPVRFAIVLGVPAAAASGRQRENARMLRTMHRYLSWDLIRVTVMALAAFTLVLTIFVIVEPLRKEGLNVEDAVTLFAMTLPSVLSLTLPIAALFAATIVYGRFAQDNEYLASRASGISTVSLFRPAFVAGVVVTVVTMTLSNLVTPRMAEMSKRLIRGDLKNVAFRKFQRYGHVRLGAWLVHADSVDEANDVLRGVVLVKEAEEGRPDVYAARWASFDVSPAEEGEAFILVHGREAAGILDGGREKLMGNTFTEELLLEDEIRDKPAWYGWGKLIRTLYNPSDNRLIRQSLRGVKRRLLAQRFCQSVEQVIRSGAPYVLVSKDGLRYEIHADVAISSPGGLLTLKMKNPGGRVTVEEVPPTGGATRYYAKLARMRPAWSAGAERARLRGQKKGLALVKLELTGPKIISAPVDDPDRTQRIKDWNPSLLLMPARLVTEVEKIDPETLRTDPAGCGVTEKGILAEIDYINTHDITKLVNRIIAEINGRLVYGLSCFLMVAMGAALGLVFRGGQMIVAFALSMIPSMLVIVLLSAGKQMIRNPDVATSLGLTAMWSGPAVLLAASVWLHLYLARK